MAKIVTSAGTRAGNPDMAAGVKFLRKDPALKKVIDKVGPCQLKPRKEYFFILCDSIISQQLSVKVSNVILERFRKGVAKGPVIRVTPSLYNSVADMDALAAALHAEHGMLL